MQLRQTENKEYKFYNLAIFSGFYITRTAIVTKLYLQSISNCYKLYHATFTCCPCDAEMTLIVNMTFPISANFSARA